MDTNRQHSSGGGSGEEEWSLLIPGDVSLHIMNDSDSHIQLKDGMVVAIGQEALHIEKKYLHQMEWSICARQVKRFLLSGWNHWSGMRR